MFRKNNNFNSISATNDVVTRMCNKAILEDDVSKGHWIEMKDSFLFGQHLCDAIYKVFLFA
jgi:hypothetical protein